MNARSLIQTLLVPAVLGAALLAQALPAAAQQVPDGGMGDHAWGRGDHDGHHAFDPARFAEHWQMRAQRLSQRLGLSPAQQQQLTTIVQAEMQRFQQTVLPLPEHTPQRHAARQALMQDFDTRVSAILTPAQRTQWDSIKQEMRARFEQRHGDHHGGAGGEEFGGPQGAF